MRMDITGKKFHSLTAVSFVDNNSTTGSRWLFRCDCGNEKIYPRNAVTHCTTKTCGCGRSKENIGSRATKHGMHKTKLYRTYYGMIQRCTNSNNTMFHLYGGRGIRVCDEWTASFETFRDWALSNGYEDKLSIDRIDSNGSYSPSNCRWSTTKEQAKNRRTSILIEWEGITESINVWSKIVGIDNNTLGYRYHKKGLRPPELFDPPNRKIK